MPRRRRLTASEDYRLAHREGRRISDELLTIYVRANTLAVCRVGITVPGRLGPAAHRNRVKRRVREASRLTEHELPGGIDVVIVPRAAAGAATFGALQESVRTLYKRVAGLHR